jgi:hypothetical protein
MGLTDNCVPSRTKLVANMLRGPPLGPVPFKQVIFAGVQKIIICYTLPFYVRETYRGIGGTALSVQIEILGLRCRSACGVLPLTGASCNLGMSDFFPGPYVTSPATPVSSDMRYNL